MTIALPKIITIRTLAIAVGVTSLAVLMWTAYVSAGRTSVSTATAILILGALVVAAANREIQLARGVTLSAQMMIVMAAVVVFQPQALLLGPAIIGAAGGLNFVKIRRREWHKVAFNAGADTLGATAMAATFWAISSGSSTVALTAVATVVSATIYIAINTVLVSAAVSVRDQLPYGSILLEMCDLLRGQEYIFAVLGVGIGYTYLEYGAAVVPLLVVPILLARASSLRVIELSAAQEQTIETLILALEAKDRYTAGHAQRVANFCEYVGAELAFGPRRMERLRYAALMHDIGKLVVPNQLLNKPGRLTESEFERVKRHETVSVELLRRIDFLAPIAGDTTTEAATAAVDGVGLIEPAIIHVADAFDAMTSTRSYRRALSQETAFAELRAGAGTQFNATCVDALISAIEQRGEHYGDGHEVDHHEWAVAPPEAGTGSAGLGHLDTDTLVSEQRTAGS